MEDHQTLHSHFDTLDTIVQQLTDQKHTVEPVMLGSITIESLPPSYNSIKLHLQTIDFSQDQNILQSTLLTHKISLKNSAQTTKESLLYTNAPQRPFPSQNQSYHRQHKPTYPTAQT